jgi:hypothetical protein
LACFEKNKFIEWAAIVGSSGARGDETNKQNPLGLQEIGTIVRTISEIDQLFLDPAAST